MGYPEPSTHPPPLMEKIREVVFNRLKFISFPLSISCCIFGLWVQILDQILGREPESQNTCLLTFVFLPWADNGTNLLANKVVQKNSTEISTLICICIGCFTLVRKVYIFNSPSNSDSAILSNHIIWSIKKWLKINRKGTIKGGGAGSDA